MIRFLVIGRQVADEGCIPSRMKSEIESLKYVCNAKHAKKFIETKEQMMTVLKN